MVHENVTPLLETQETLRRTNSMIAGVWKRRSRPLSDVDLHRVAVACRTESDRLIVFTLIDAGLRVSELTRIVPEDFDWDAPSLRVGRGDKDSGAPRVLPLTERACAIWRGYLSRRPEFRMSTRQIQRIVRAVGDAAGLPGLSPQKLRQTCAVRLVENGATEAILSYAMGYEYSEAVAPPEFPELARLFGVRDR